MRVWRNWQTRQTQDLVGDRAGSIPVTRTVCLGSEIFDFQGFQGFFFCIKKGRGSFIRSLPFPYFIPSPAWELLSYFHIFCYFITFSKSLAGCLHHGQIKSSGICSPSYSYPHTVQRHTVLSVTCSDDNFGCGFGLIFS